MNLIKRPHILGRLWNWSEDWKASQFLHCIKVCFLILCLWNLDITCYLYMNEVDSFIFCCMFFHELKNCIFYVLFQKWYQSGLQSHFCITFWVSFRIKENWFCDFENSAVDFFAFLVLELWFDKTEIDFMMLF